MKPRTIHSYRSEAMNQLLRMVKRIAPSNASVLIMGEPGTGKKAVAALIHEESNRKEKPYVEINCGALRETLLESELFGHEKGAFTGAYTRKIGLAEVANGGTLVLSEVDQLTPGIQAKLLRFLQEGEIYRVGGKDPIQMNVRLICVTSKSLDEEVVRGNFREDLYYRINTIMLKVPELRRRKEDIVSIANEFLGRSAVHIPKTFDPEAMKAIENYDWPGNVRQLQNECERLLVLVPTDLITLNDLPEHIRTNIPPRGKIESFYDPDLTLHELEKRYIMRALEYYEGNKTQAANALGITIKTLYNKLHEYGEFDKFARYPR